MKLTRTQTLTLIPWVITGLSLTYCWAFILFTETMATWKHYSGLILFLPLSYLVFRKMFKPLIIGTGLYILLGSFNLIAITPTIYTWWVAVGPVSTPELQLFFLGIFILYIILNLNPLIEIYLDYKEAKALKK